MQQFEKVLLFPDAQKRRAVEAVACLCHVHVADFVSHPLEYGIVSESQACCTNWLMNHIRSGYACSDTLLTAYKQ